MESCQKELTEIVIKNYRDLVIIALLACQEKTITKSRNRING